MDILLQDVRYAARKLFRAPGFTLIAVATLALAIGATTAVFSIVNGVLLKPLPYRNPGELVKLGSKSKTGSLVHLSVPDFIDYRNQTHSFVAVAQIQDGNSANLRVAGEDAVRLTSTSVGARFFELLGTPMELGRGFVAGEDEKAAQPVVVLSDKLWRRQFAADPRIIGRVVSLNGVDRTVVGVAPPSETYPDQPDLWIPFVFEPWMAEPDNRGAHFISAVARLRPGSSVDDAKRDMGVVGARLQKEYPRSNAEFGGAAQGLQESIVGDVTHLLYTMFGAVGFVLLIACANVANLLLVRASSRETEIAVRTALGAGRGRIIRQLITESLLISAAGAVVGAALAAWSVDAIVAFGPRGLPRIQDISVDPRVLAFTVLVALVTGFTFGLVPAFHAAKSELGQMLKENVRGTSGRRATQRTRSALVIAEMALAVVLLVGAGLLIRSFMKLVQVDPGFRAERVVSFNVSLPDVKYVNDRDIRRFAAEVKSGLATLPGTQSAAVAFTRPLENQSMRASFDVDGQPERAADKRMTADLRPVSADFFSTMGMRLVRGRLFSAAEEDFGPPPVVVVTESFVKRYFPTSDPIGQHLTLGISHDTAGTNSSVRSRGEIVGVVNDVHQRGLNDDAYPAVYLGWGTLPLTDIAFLVRSSAEMQAISAGIRDRVRAADPAVPIFDLNTMKDLVTESVAQPRFYMLLLSAFAMLALLLAALGIYGVISYSVSQRTRELGIRIALGATQDRVVRLVLGQGVMLTMVGVATGLVGAYWLMHLLAALLFGVGATDGGTFIAVAVVLAGVASLASYVPARRAAKVDPVIAMRAE
jgi:putative ABC transport system permease protein